MKETDVPDDFNIVDVVNGNYKPGTFPPDVERKLAQIAGRPIVPPKLEIVKNDHDTFK